MSRNVKRTEGGDLVNIAGDHEMGSIKRNISGQVIHRGDRRTIQGRGPEKL